MIEVLRDINYNFDGKEYTLKKGDVLPLLNGDQENVVVITPLNHTLFVYADGYYLTIKQQNGGI